MSKQNPSPQEIVAGLAYFNATELPRLRTDIDSIGPSLTNATNCMLRMHNIVSYLVRHCLQNVVLAQAAARTQQASSEEQAAEGDQESQMRAALAAAAGSPGAAVPMPDLPGMSVVPITPQAPLAPAMRNVVVGRNDDATTRAVLGGTPENFEPEPGEVPFVIIGQGGSKVIPPKGSTAAPKTFAPGQPIDTTFAVPAPGTDPSAP
jgi:hypothetical protein